MGSTERLIKQLQSSGGVVLKDKGLRIGFGSKQSVEEKPKGGSSYAVGMNVYDDSEEFQPWLTDGGSSDGRASDR